MIRSLGSRPTKQLATMGILVSCSSICLSAADPRSEAASWFAPRWSLWGGVEAPVMLPLIYEVRGSKQRRQLRGWGGDLSNSPAPLLVPRHAVACKVSSTTNTVIKCHSCSVCLVIPPVTIAIDFVCPSGKTEINVVKTCRSSCFFPNDKFRF